MIDAETAQKIADRFLIEKSVERNINGARWSKAHSLVYRYEELVIDGERILERDFGWAFSAVTKTFVKTRSLEDLIIGGIYFVVARNDGSVTELNEVAGFTNAVDDYEAPFRGFGAERYDLIVHEVHRMQETLDFLAKLNLTSWQPYVSPAGAQLMAGRFYKMEQLTKMLSDLPCRFLSQNVRRYFRVFQQMNETRDCVYELNALIGEAARHPNHKIIEKMKRQCEEVN